MARWNRCRDGSDCFSRYFFLWVLCRLRLIIINFVHDSRPWFCQKLKYCLFLFQNIAFDSFPKTLGFGKKMESKHFFGTISNYCKTKKNYPLQECFGYTRVMIPTNFQLCCFYLKTTKLKKE